MKARPAVFATALAAAALLSALPTLAQDTDPPIAARIAWLSGSVSLESQGAQDWSVAPLNYPMVGGDRIYTGDGARAVIQSGPIDVRIGGGSDVTLTNLTEQYEQIGIAEGSVRVRAFAVAQGGTIEVDTPSGAVIIQNPGDYRVNVYPDQQASVVEVNTGTVQIAGPGVNQEVDQGEAVQLYGTDQVEIGAVDMPPYDDLDTWSMNRDRHILGSASARYVSRDIPGYDDLDDYGGWTATPDYGPIWFPNQVAAGWQPYTTGHWAYVQPWGYTWVDDATWGYAPFHYGRWVVWNGRWGWAPGPPEVRPVYAPAFVAFVGGGPGLSVGVSVGGGGVAAWFPLGVAEPYVPWYRCSPAYVRTVNVTNVNITVIHNVTVVNNYNVFINHVTTVRSVNEIQVTNVNYANRERVVAVPAAAMSSGARVQQAAVHMNAQQQQELSRAPVAVARPPAPPPPHPAPGVHANVSRPAAAPVLMTTHGRAAATPTSNTAHFAPPVAKPAPATAIKPATHAAAPNVHPAAPANNAGRPGAPAAPPATRTATPANPPANAAHPAPTAPSRPAYTPPAQPGRTPPENNHPATPPERTTPTPPARTAPPPPPAKTPTTPPARTTPQPPVRSAPPPTVAPRPVTPENRATPPPARTTPTPPPARTTPPPERITPPPARTTPPPPTRPAPEARPTPPPEKNPPPKNEKKPPPKDEHPPQG